MIAEEGKAGRTLGERWSAILVPSPAASDTPALESVLHDPQFDPEGLMQTWLSNIPLGRIGEAEEIVGPALFLVSDASSMVTSTILYVDAGYLAR